MATKKRQDPFKLIPPGMYAGELVEVKVREGEHAGMSLKFRITEGPHRGRVVFLGLGPGSRLRANLDIRHQKIDGAVLSVVFGIAVGSLRAAYAIHEKEKNR